MPVNPFGRKWRVVGRVDLREPRADEQCERQQFHNHHDVVRARALACTEQQQPGHGHDNRGRRHIHEHRNAGNFGCGLQKSVHDGIGTQQRGSISSREPHRQTYESASERLEIIAPRNGDGDISNRVLENQIPTNDPGDNFAQRRIRNA